MSILLRGKNLNLRPFETTDLEKIAGWLNSDTATHYMFYGRLPATDEQVKKLFEDYLSGDENIIFTVVDKATGLAIGFGGLFDIDYVSRKAEIRLLIGEQQFRGQDYGMEAFALITHYGFDRLDLNMMYGGITRPDNRGPKKFYEYLGCKINGVQRELAYRNGTYCDGIMIDILRSEYYPKILEFYKKNFGIEVTNQK